MTAKKVLIVDDSALMRQMLSDILSRDDDLVVVGVAPDAPTARSKIKQLDPDVVTLDVELPGMDGMSFLEKIMRLRPMPVVMISGRTQADSDLALRALEIGAIDVIGKSAINIDPRIADKSAEIIEKVKAAAAVNTYALRQVGKTGRSGEPPVAVDAPTGSTASIASADAVVAIGASAGGVEAMRTLVQQIPVNFPPILYVQHMPADFTPRYARRLDEISRIGIAEAREGQQLEPGHLYLAPGDQHLRLARKGRRFACHLTDGAPISGHRPSIDVLFESVAAVAGEKAVGTILTGMGRDGASGLLGMRETGAATIGQDEATSLVYGMPKVAFEIGAVAEQRPLGKIIPGILQACRKKGLLVSS